MREGILPTNVLLLVETNRSPSMEEQRAACEADGDLIVDAGPVRFNDLPKQLALHGHELKRGDRIKVYDLNCLPLSTSTLLRLMAKILGMGIAIEFCRPGITIDPGAQSGDLSRFVIELDRHARHVHGLKRQAHETKTGRKPTLPDDQLPEIRQLLAVAGATVTSVARELGVGRTTLFDYLRRHKDAEDAAMASAES